MNLSSSPLPPALRDRVAADLAPVRPLAPPARRAAWLGLLALAGVLLAWLRLRGADAPAAPIGLAVAVAQWFAGVGMVWVALREAVPALGLGRVRAGLTLAAGLAVQLVSALLLATERSAGWLGDGGAAVGALCLRGQGWFGLPLLAAATWLMLRGFPVRTGLASALVGGAAGLFGDAAWHLVCTRTDLAHVVVWHFGATVAFAAAGYLAGVAAERRRLAT